MNQDPEIWNEEYLPIDDLIDEEQNIGDIQSKEEELVLMVLLQLFACQNRYFLSDAALESVIKILKLFLTLIGDRLSLPGFDCLLSHFPSSLFLAKKKSGVHSNTSKKYVCCTSCSSIYPSESCSKIVDGKKESKLCSFVRFLNHPQPKFRSQCGEVLMKSICSADSKTNYLYPKKLYCYNPLIQSLHLQSLVTRTEIRKSLLDGPVKSSNETMFDTIDGHFWKDFKDVNYGWFFVAIFIKKKYGHQKKYMVINHKIWSSNHKIWSSGMPDEHIFIHRACYGCFSLAKLIQNKFVIQVKKILSSTQKILSSTQKKWSSKKKVVVK